MKLTPQKEGGDMYYVLAGLVFLLYWTPTIVGYARHVPNQGSVLVIDAFLGWTVVGWVVALAMACRSVPQPVELPAPRQT